MHHGRAAARPLMTLPLLSTTEIAGSVIKGVPMRSLAVLLALIGAPAIAAPQPQVDTEKPETAIEPIQRETVVPCLAPQRPSRSVIVILRAQDGTVLMIGAIKVRQRC